jgi:hypothetical protein
MEPEGSLQCSQQPATGPLPEPDAYTLTHIYTCTLRSILILYSHLRLGLPSGLFHSHFPN